MARQFLSTQAPRGEDAAVLRGALCDRRDQQYLLSHAEREERRRLERGDARAVQADPEGAAADHASGAPARLRGRGAVFPAGVCNPRAEARRAVVPTPALPEKGSRAVRCVPADAAAGHVCEIGRASCRERGWIWVEDVVANNKEADRRD